MSEKILNETGKFFIENDNHNNFQGAIIKENNNYKLKIYDHDFDSYNNDRILINGTIKNEKVSFVIFNKFSSFIYCVGKIETRIYNIEQLFIHKGFFGTFFERLDDIKFKNITIKINNMNSTLAYSSPLVELSKPINVSMQKYPILIKHVSFVDFELKIGLNCNQKCQAYGDRNIIQFKEEPVITLLYKHKQDINRIIEDIKIIKHLFTFLTGKSEIIEIKGIKGEQEVIALKLEIISDNYENEIVMAPIVLTEKNMESIFYFWFDNFKKLNGVYELYYSIEEYNIPPHILLTTYTQILESYHRHKYGKNNSKFKDRIIQICDDLKQYEIFEQIIKPYDLTQIDDFAEDIRINRNYYTHYDKKNKEDAFKGRELKELDHSLKRLINLIFLKELKLDLNEINKITANMSRFKELIFLDDI